jgi:hypothetical protein
MPGIGYLLGGLLTQLGSPRTAFAFAGAGVLVLVVGALILRPTHDEGQTSTTTGKTIGRRLSRS